LFATNAFLSNYQLPITNYQLPITNYQLPITNYPLPITHYQLPITHYQLPITITKKYMSEWIEIGTIVAAQGLDGEVRIYPDSDFPERFIEPGKRWLLHPNKTEPEPIEFLGGRYIPGKGLYAVEVEGVEDRDSAEALRGCKLFVEKSDRPYLEPDEFYVQDLLGMEVFNQLTGQVLGKVTNIIPAGNDLLEVETNLTPLENIPPEPEKLETPKVEVVDPRNTRKPRKPRVAKSKSTKVLIPFVKEIVPIVDLEKGRIEISPPPGLLDEI
jgi:16S rRNA processing protein RimM